MALNKVIIMGRITQDLEIRQTPSGVACLTFTVAVDRNYSKQSEEKQTDFINCVAWKQHAEFIGKYFGKGRMIAIEGQLRTRTYIDKSNAKRYVTEVFVDGSSFTGEPKQGTYGNIYESQGSYQSGSTNASQSVQQADEPLYKESNDFEDIISDDGVPF